MSNEKITPSHGFTPVEELSFEQAFAELEEVVAVLETGEQDLDGSVALFERGQALANHCAGLLDQAELKIQQLSSEDVVDFIPED
jgi:exodeoxyribonuclease VII small subunit